MSTTPPPLPPGARAPFWRLSLRTWLLIAAAFGIGLLLFLLLWSGKRDNGFFRATPTAVPDLMAALEASIASAKRQGGTAAAKPAGKKKAPAKKKPAAASKAKAPAKKRAPAKKKTAAKK